MKYFERKRRSLFKNHYINGAEKSVSGVDSIEIKSSAGVPLKSLEITGLSEQTIELDQFKKHKAYFTSLENYVKGDVTSMWVIPFPDEWLGKELTFSLVEKTKMTDISFELSDGVGLFASSERLLGYNGEIKSVTSSAYSYFRFTGVLVDNLYLINQFWQNYEVSAIGIQPDFPEPVRCLNDNGMKISLSGEGFKKEINVPTAVQISGKDIPLLFSNYDTLTLDGAEKKVVYTTQVLKYTFKGTENIALNNWALSRGYGNYYTCAIGSGLDSLLLGCSHFKKGVWTENGTMKTQMNVYGSIDQWQIWIRTDGEQTVDEFKAWLKAQYENGTPVYVIVKLKSPKSYDLSDTDFGKELLSLYPAAEKDATFKIEGALDGVPVSLVYYSTEEADKSKITIKYVDEEGNEIAEEKVNEVRKGSKYLIIAPHIDGYKRVSSEVYGVADEDREIELIYRKG